MMSCIFTTVSVEGGAAREDVAVVVVTLTAEPCNCQKHRAAQHAAVLQVVVNSPACSVFFLNDLYLDIRLFVIVEYFRGGSRMTCTQNFPCCQSVSV